MRSKKISGSLSIGAICGYISGADHVIAWNATPIRLSDQRDDSLQIAVGPTKECERTDYGSKI
jgi:hypothetical protein